ncbi:MAG: energy transducer TonB [Rhodothermaceae bacterium]|nr:energy transducer TonB [Rhodothermaceae bacterium]
MKHTTTYISGIIALLLAASISQDVYGQQSEMADSIYIMVEEMPRPVGGLRGIQKKAKYPKELRKQGVKGRVFITFIVDEKGEVRDTEVLRSVHPELDEQAERAVMSTKFKPGKQNGVPVKVKMSVPFTFGNP